MCTHYVPCMCVFHSPCTDKHSLNIHRENLYANPSPLQWMSCMITILACENNIDWERERETKWKMRWLLEYVLPDKLKLHLSKCLQEPVHINVLMLKLLKVDVDRRCTEQSGNPAGYIFIMRAFSLIVSYCTFCDCSFSCLQFIPLLRWEGHAQILSVLAFPLRGKHCLISLCFPAGLKAQHALSAASCSESFRAVGEHRSPV